MRIPQSELRFHFARASGAGGQNVNKVSTKVLLEWDVMHSRVLDDAQKQRIRTVLSHRLNSGSILSIAVDDTRSQSQNRQIAIKRLETMVTHALYIPKKRRATRPTRASQEKRLESKKKRTLIKTSRKKIKPTI